MRFALLITLLLFFIGVINCESVPKKENVQQANDTSQETSLEKKLEKQKIVFLEKISKQYKIYKSIYAVFKIKGRVNHKDLSYTGTLYATNKNKDHLNNDIKIILKDPIFLSPVFSIQVYKNTVIQKDLLRDKTQRIPLYRYRWVQILGSVFPFQFFLPILKGFPPQQIYAKSSKYNHDKSKILYQSHSYDIVSKFKNSIMSNLYFKSKIKNDILIIALTGQARGSQKRYLPKTIYITKSGKSNDYVKIIFSYIKVKMFK